MQPKQCQVPIAPMKLSMRALRWCIVIARGCALAPATWNIALNVGREGETLLHYIIQDYDRLPESLWFLQGDPFTHQPQVKKLFNPEIVALYNRTFQPLTMQFAEYARLPWLRWYLLVLQVG